MSISLDTVSFAYPGGPTILDQASIDIPSGSFVLVRGPSGAGKSTLLRLLCLLEEPQSGTILLDGTPISDIPPPHLRREVAYVQQMPTMLPGTVRDNLLLPFSFQANSGLSKPDDRQLTDHLNNFLLSGVHPDTEAKSLSVGQAQRVSLIRSLLLDPSVLLMDEPTASLDAASAEIVLNQAARLSEAGISVIMISHSDHKPAGVTHTMTIQQGKVVYQ